MGGGSYSTESYRSTARRLISSGRPVTHRGEEHAQKTKSLHSLVDPKTHDVSREAVNYFEEQPDHRFLLVNGTALPKKTSFDCTGSMGANIEHCFHSLPRSQHLLVLANQAALGDYHTQIATAVIQDVSDNYPHEHSEFERDNRIENQMELLVPEKDGGDSTEDYQLDMFYTARRIKTSINSYGLKGYHFIAGDEIGRDRLTTHDINEVYGLNNVQEISVVELGKELLETWHVFFLQIGDRNHTTNYWSKVLGSERVIIVPRTEYLAEVEAVICALTEGKADLQNAADWLIEVSSQNEEKSHHVSKETAKTIVRAVSHIPLRAQADLSNFGKLPKAGSIFTATNDLWPVEEPLAITSPDEIDWANQL